MAHILLTLLLLVLLFLAHTPPLAAEHTNSDNNDHHHHNNNEDNQSPQHTQSQQRQEQEQQRRRNGPDSPYLLPFDFSAAYGPETEITSKALSANATQRRNNVRRLAGSNCIYIERGVVTPYYDCLGCVVEEAVACITDMRTNVSGTVRAGCNINKMNERPDSRCCPTVQGNALLAAGSSYAQGLLCMQRAGCQDSFFFQDVLAECRRACTASDPAVCLAALSDAPRLRSMNIFPALLIIVMVSLLQFLM